MNTMSALKESTRSRRRVPRGWRPTPESAPALVREVAADVEFFVGVALSSACASVSAAMNALQPGIDHAVDGADTAAADADDLDDSQIVLRIRHHPGIPRARSVEQCPGTQRCAPE